MIIINTKVPEHSGWFAKYHEFAHALHAHMAPNHFLRLKMKDAKRRVSWPLRFTEQAAHHLAIAIADWRGRPLELDECDRWLSDITPPPLKQDIDCLVIGPGFHNSEVLATLEHYEKFNFQSAPWVSERDLMDLRLSSTLGITVRRVTL
jgi:hypothetical protein